MPCVLKSAFFVGVLISAFTASTHAQLQRCPLITQITLEECRTLEKLFFDTDGPNWINIRGWLRSNQPCEWYGITCKSEAWPRRITKIDLSGNDLTGPLPGELSRLTELRELRIDNSGPGVRFRKLTGNLPAVLGQLEHLEILLLGDNDFTGSIPLEYGELSNLREFSLANSNLTGPIPESFGKLQSLEQLDLSGNQLAGKIPEQLGTLTELTALDLSANLLSGPLPDALGQLTDLRSLNLSGNALSGAFPDAIAILDRVIWLSFADNNLAGPLPLKSARFASTIISCDLDGNNLCIPDNPAYEELGAGPICGLPKKRSCRVCSGADCDALELIFSSTDGKSWSASTGWLATESPCEWHGIDCEDDRVTRLILPDNALGGILPNALAQLPRLQHLDLAGNKLGGTLPESLATLTDLSVMDLSNNLLTGTVSLPMASLGLRTRTCDLSGNPGLCVPDDPDYRTLGETAICGLELSPVCGQFPLAEMSELRIEPLERSARLLWEVLAPAEGIRFDIEKVSGQDVTVIGSTQGVMEAPTAYFFEAADLAPGVHTFQVRQVSPSGASRVTGPVSITLYQAGVSVDGPYPNPFRAHTRLTLIAGSMLTLQVEVFDVTGRRIQTLYNGQPALHNPWTLQFGNASLPGGTYFIRVTASGSNTQTFQVQHIR